MKKFLIRNDDVAFDTKFEEINQRFGLPGLCSVGNSSIL